MHRNNLLSLHEAIVVAMINLSGRKGTFEEIANFIEKRSLFPERKGNIPLTKQVMLRATKSSQRYEYLFEDLGNDTISLRNL